MNPSPLSASRRPPDPTSLHPQHGDLPLSSLTRPSCEVRQLRVLLGPWLPACETLATRGPSEGHQPAPSRPRGLRAPGGAGGWATAPVVLPSEPHTRVVLTALDVSVQLLLLYF